MGLSMLSTTETNEWVFWLNSSEKRTLPITVSPNKNTRYAQYYNPTPPRLNVLPRHPD